MKKLMGIIVIAAIIIGVFYVYNKSNEKEEDSYKIGVILPMTGKLSFMGDQEKQGMLIALEDLEQQGKKIQLIFEDGKSDPKASASAALKLIQYDNVDCIITSTTGASKAVQAITDKNQIDLIAFCMDPEIAKSSEYVTRLYEGTDEEAFPIANYIENEPGAQNIALLFNQVDAWKNSMDKIIKPAIEKGGKTLVYEEEYAIGETNLRDIVIKLRNANPDHIVLLSYGFEYPILIPMLKEYGLFANTKILGGWGFIYPQVPLSEVEGVYVSGPQYMFERGTLASEFITKFNEKFKGTPNFDAAMAYNVVWLIGNNYLKKGERTFKEFFKNTQIEESVIGDYFINGDGELIMTTSLGRYENGEIVAK